LCPAPFGAALGQPLLLQATQSRQVRTSRPLNSAIVAGAKRATSTAGGTVALMRDSFSGSVAARFALALGRWSLDPGPRARRWTLVAGALAGARNPLARQGDCATGCDQVNRK